MVDMVIWLVVNCSDDAMVSGGEWQCFYFSTSPWLREYYSVAVAVGTEGNIRDCYCPDHLPYAMKLVRQYAMQPL